MQGQAIVTILAAVLVPVVTAVLGLVGVMFRDWRQRRSRAGQRKLALEDATRQVTFASEWWKAKQELELPPEELAAAKARVRIWLDEASSRVLAAERIYGNQEWRSPVRRLFLAHPMQRRAAKVARFGCYVCLVLVVASSGRAIGEALTGYPRGDVVWQFTWLFLFGVLAFILRFWSDSLEHADQRPRNQQQYRYRYR